MNNETKAHIIERAQALGSKAQTFPRAVWYLYDRRELLATPAPSNFLWSLTGDRLIDLEYSRAGYRRQYHLARLTARYTRLGEEMMQAYSLPVYNLAKDRARVNRIERAKQLKIAHASESEKSLQAAGYKLERKGTHRVLSGLDDGHAFSVEVPLHRQTIAEAIDWLRPAGVSKNALRQGEWFFVPSEPEAELPEYECNGGTRVVGHYEIDSFDRRGRHMPTQCLAVVASGMTNRHKWEARPKIYARGVVYHPEHGDLMLGDCWHEVIPNRAHGPFGVGEFSGGLD